MTDKHPCPLCGRELYWALDLDAPNCGEWVCNATHDQHELAALKLERDELKRELEEAKAKLALIHFKEQNFPRLCPMCDRPKEDEHADLL